MQNGKLPPQPPNAPIPPPPPSLSQASSNPKQINKKPAVPGPPPPPAPGPPPPPAPSPSSDVQPPRQSNNAKGNLLAEIRKKRIVEEEQPPQDKPSIQINLYSCGSGAYGRLAKGNTRNEWNLTPCYSGHSITIKKLVTGAGHLLALAFDNNDNENGINNSKKNESVFHSIKHKVEDTLEHLHLHPHHHHNNNNNNNNNNNEERTAYVYSWGKCHFGQLGHGFMDCDRYLPTKIEALSQVRIKSIAAGDSFCLAISEEGNFYGWGCGYCGALGSGNEQTLTKPQLIPVQFQFPNEVPVNVFAGAFHSIILTSLGNFYVFGRNNTGQLGLGDLMNRFVPTLIQSDVKWKAAACGAKFSLFLAENGDVYRVGSEFLSPDIAAQAPEFHHQMEIYKTPQKIDNIKDIVQIAAGKRLSLLLDQNGVVYLDNGGLDLIKQQTMDTSNQNIYSNLNWNSPSFLVVPFPVGHQIVTIGCGEYHCLATDDKGGIFSWGCPLYGKLSRESSRKYDSDPQLCEINVKHLPVHCIEASGGSNHTFVIVK